MSSGQQQPASEFIRAMEPVARELLGSPNMALSSKTELRFGTRGSMSVRLDTGTWCDHENGGAGGGVLDLVQQRRRLDKSDALAWLRERGHLPPLEGQMRSSKKIVATYPYHDERGEVLFEVVRYEPKDFRQRKPDGTGDWDWKVGNTRRVLFRLPEVLEAVRTGRTVYVAEGEKGVLALVNAGLDATCSPGGAGKWRSEYSSILAGAHVVILPDNDEPGRAHASQVLDFLRGVAYRARVVELPGLADKQDVVDFFASGGTWESLEELCEEAEVTPAEAEPQPTAAPRERFRILSPADCDVARPRAYVIKGLLSRGDHIQMIGQPGAGKSVLAPHLAYAVAQGRSVFGLRVRQGPVLYLAAEDGHGMTARIRALHGRWGDAPAFHLIPASVDLLNTPADVTELGAIVARLQPVLIVVDTLARAFPGLAENEAEAMGNVVRVVRNLASICGSSVIVVHHVAKDGGETPRGHGSLNADADTTIIVAGSGAEARKVRLGKNRNGSSDQAFTFDLIIRVLGEDEDGDPITAPTADEIRTTTVDTGRRAREAKLKAKPASMLAEYRQSASLTEPLEPEPGAPIVLALGRETFRRVLIDRGWFADNLLRTASNPPTLERAGYTAENHALTALKNAGLLNFNRLWVWLI